MKIHHNIALDPKKFISIACGIGGVGIPATTDVSKVTCKNCLRWKLYSKPGPVLCYDDDGVSVEYGK